MAPTTTTKSLSLFFFLLLSHALLSAKAQQRQIEGCAPFSCGQLQNISYPFRRRDDPPHCGEALYQLNCQGNKSTFSIGSVEYLVTKINQHNFFCCSQISWYDDFIHLVDPNFVGGGSCGLPSQSLSPDILKSMGFWAELDQWASFMNCSEPIKQKDSGFWPVPCLSSPYTSSFVYVFITRGGYALQHFPPSCQFISMIPVAYNYDLNSTVDDVFSILQHGFYLERTRVKSAFCDSLHEFNVSMSPL